MTNAETVSIISLLTTALENLPEADKEEASSFNALWKANGQFNINDSFIKWGTGGYIQNAINLLNADLVAMENKAQAKAKGDTKRLKAALAWQTRQKKKNAAKEILNYPDYQGDMQVYTDGYMIVALNNHLAFEEKPDKFTNCEYGIKLEKVMPHTHGEEIEMPDLAKLKVWYKTEKKNNKNKRKKWIEYCFGDYTAPVINAEFLITAMEIMTPDTKWYASNPHKSTDREGKEFAVTNVYAENSIGEKCYICGLRAFKDNHNGKTEL